MSEDAFLLLFGLSYGIPLILSSILFGIAMSRHNDYLNQREAWLNSIAYEREQREKNQ